MEKIRVIASGVYVVDIVTKEETRIFGEMIFGRAEVDKNFPHDTLISRRHFRLVPSDNEILVEDLGSTNRTKVNGKLLKANKYYKLKNCDVIEFGQQKFQVFIGRKIEDEAAQPEPKKLFERSMVFERYPAEGAGNLGASGGAGPICIDDSILQILVQKKTAVWYLQFSGKEFGPFSFKELKALVQDRQFQGSALYAFTEGLIDWLPVERFGRFIE